MSFTQIACPICGSPEVASIIKLSWTCGNCGHEYDAIEAESKKASELSKKKGMKAAELKNHIGKECFVKQIGSTTKYVRCILVNHYKPGIGGNMCEVVPLHNPSEPVSVRSKRVAWTLPPGCVEIMTCLLPGPEKTLKPKVGVAVDENPF